MHEPFPGALNFGVPALSFLAGLLTKGFIENRYARSIEALKFSFKRQENNIENFRAQVDNLRGVLFERSSARLAMLEQKRLENAQAIWDHYVALAPFRSLEFAAKALDFEKMMKTASLGNQQAVRMKEFAATTLILADGSQKYLDSKVGIEANKLELFTDDQTWEVFNAYRSAVMLPYMKIKLISIGADPDMLKDATNLIDQVKRILPEYQDYLHQNGENALPYLYIHLEKRLIFHLKATFGAKTNEDVADLQEIQQAINSAKLKELCLGREYANTATPPNIDS